LVDEFTEIMEGVRPQELISHGKNKLTSDLEVSYWKVLRGE
jgi:hypothetical protein